ncbi:hypothetical protein LOC68_06805 [Blastopirellula sp. JC732]|uniref:Uncharacterized protein n=1 Tax=Blastopirellula sediminis TaxID=2894196 RepID=A0A9X1MMA8_9BACT|nr:hypothetical protein [Blastopirellula sediminis]MCC9609124.1 hypothetical protein [Blastopirellula sediminis]MCC9628099.1 hypothetical protein [Blastopirellula sediminis]
MELSTSDFSIGDFASTPLRVNLSEHELEVRVQVRSIIGAAGKGARLAYADRRRDQRYPFPHLLYLTPVNKAGEPLVEQTVVVVGKTLTERGMDFYHQQPIPHRRVIVTIETPGGYIASFLMDLTWCRYTKQGWYDNGGRFLNTVPSPFPAGMSRI